MAGVLLTWSSPVFPRLNTINDDNPFGKVVTPSEQSLISSLLPLGASLGPIIAGLLTDRIGRKKTLLIFSGIPLAGASITLIFAKSILVYYIARFIAGVGVANTFVVIPIYLSEISEVSIRGMVASSFGFFCAVGQLFSYSVGPYVSIVTFNTICAVIPILFVLTFLFCPESPHYSISKKDMNTAQVSLSKLRNMSTEDVDRELKLIKENVENALKNEGIILDIFTNKGYRKAFLICLGLFTFQQFSGILAILFNASDIFAASGSSLDSSISAIVIGAVQVFACLITPIFVDRLGRKMLLQLSVIGMVISEIPLGLYYFLKDHDYNVESISWLPVTCLIVFILTYAWGLGSVSWILVGEVFPTNIKAAASTMVTSYCWFLAFVVSTLFLSLINLMGMGGALLFFASCCCVAIVFTFCFVFETAGKTIQQIQEMLNK
ncbi:facilitated trehalose transporter Tret1-like isoform X2 [Agrilus planipennis]|nr:facilitated trehalose transporter Tret1-like isoform X2 [Agrilus planipennis]XP_025830281.1 facilitated trehalose transporter Tret1-like isoform X2 [Agrilus planipennis]